VIVPRHQGKLYRLGKRLDIDSSRQSSVRKEAQTGITR
jgi:hypothetical protein